MHLYCWSLVWCCRLGPFRWDTSVAHGSTVDACHVVTCWVVEVVFISCSGNVAALGSDEDKALRKMAAGKARLNMIRYIFG